MRRLPHNLRLSLNRAGNPLISVQVTTACVHVCISPLHVCRRAYVFAHTAFVRACVGRVYVCVHAKKNTTANHITQQDGNTSIETTYISHSDIERDENSAG